MGGRCNLSASAFAYIYEQGNGYLWLFQGAYGLGSRPRITDVWGLFSRPLQTLSDVEKPHLEKLETRKYTLIDDSIPDFAAPFAEKVDRLGLMP
jgi:hypothetical protein